MMILFVFLFSDWTLAAVNVQSQVDRNEMGLGDTLTLSVSVQSNDSVEVTEPRVPNLNGFDLVNSSSASSTSTTVVRTEATVSPSRNRWIDAVMAR